uniref:Membrane spanning 4-domains A5 n=1 Tax=Pipistrellus kuhlii TaxID=59472 RepID=A0A7J7X0R9_PIPKU|nr:membrane spanning 4-domains A5 [Pipistrellus kuhlii]
MDSNSAQHPVFMVFPPEVTASELQSMKNTVTAYDSTMPFLKCFTKKIKIFGFIYSGACLIALERKGTQTVMRMSQTMNCFSVLAAIVGIILLVLGFILDRNYLCGYSGEVSECKAVNTLFIGILIMLVVFSTTELLIAIFYSIFSRSFDCCDCEEWC